MWAPCTAESLKPDTGTERGLLRMVAKKRDLKHTLTKSGPSSHHRMCLAVDADMAATLLSRVAEVQVMWTEATQNSQSSLI